MAVSTQIVIFWFVTQADRKAEGNFCLHLQDQNEWGNMQPKYTGRVISMAVP
jgi:hypothetical protein